MKIALISSALNVEDSRLKEVAENLAEIFHREKIELVTGGCAGIPEIAVRKLAQLNGVTTIFSPDPDEDSHAKREDNLPLGVASKYFHSTGFTQRSLEMLNYADSVIVVNGRMGTLSEFAVALEEGKRVGVVTNTGGIADHLEVITKLTTKNFPGKLFFSNDVEEVINWLQNTVQ